MELDLDALVHAISRDAFFAGCRAAGGISSNKRSEAAFQHYLEGALCGTCGAPKVTLRRRGVATIRVCSADREHDTRPERRRS